MKIKTYNDLAQETIELNRQITDLKRKLAQIRELSQIGTESQDRAIKACELIRKLTGGKE